MKEVQIFRARPIGNQAIEPTTIIISDVVPYFLQEQDWQQIAVNTYRHQAKTLAAVLQETLPGGTFDRLLVEMMERKASLLSVPWGQQP